MNTDLKRMMQLQQRIILEKEPVPMERLEPLPARGTPHGKGSSRNEVVINQSSSHSKFQKQPTHTSKASKEGMDDEDFGHSDATIEKLETDMDNLRKECYGRFVS